MTLRAIDKQVQIGSSPLQGDPGDKKPSSSASHKYSEDIGTTVLYPLKNFLKTFRSRRKVLFPTLPPIHIFYLPVYHLSHHLRKQMDKQLLLQKGQHEDSNTGAMLLVRIHQPFAIAFLLFSNHFLTIF